MPTEVMLKVPCLGTVGKFDSFCTANFVISYIFYLENTVSWRQHIVA